MSANPQPLWERDAQGVVLYDRLIPTPRCDPLEAQVIRLADRLDRRNVADEKPPVPPNVMAAIAASVTLTTEAMKAQMPDVAAAVQTGIAETFTLLGVDITDKVEVRRFKENDRFVTSWREATGKMFGHAQLVFTGVIVVGALMLLYANFVPPKPPAFYPTVNPATGRP